MQFKRRQTVKPIGAVSLNCDSNSVVAHLRLQQQILHKVSNSVKHFLNTGTEI